MRSRSLALAFTAFLLCGWTDPTPTADEIIAKHIEALGGKAAWDKVRTMTLTGTYTGFSMPHPFTLHRRRPHHLFMSFTLGDKPITLGWNGEIAWWINPWYRIDWPVPMGTADTRAMIQETSLATPFLDYRQAGFTVAFQGEKELEGQKGLVLALTRPDGQTESWYLDPETYLHFGRTSMGSDFGQPIAQTTWFSDFRKVGGLQLPYLIEWEFRTRHRVMEVDEITLSPEWKSDPFDLPFPEAMNPLRHLIGTWLVDVQTRNSPNAQWQSSTSSSTIVAELGGTALEERIRFGTEPAIRYRRWFTFDRTRNLFRVVQVDDFTTQAAVLEGTFGENGLRLDNLATNSAWKAFDKTFHTRVVISEVGKEGFSLTMAQSEDGGENWLETARLKYRRSEGRASSH